MGGENGYLEGLFEFRKIMSPRPVGYCWMEGDRIDGGKQKIRELIRILFVISLIMIFIQEYLLVVLCVTLREGNHQPCQSFSNIARHSIPKKRALYNVAPI